MSSPSAVPSAPTVPAIALRRQISQIVALAVASDVAPDVFTRLEFRRRTLVNDDRIEGLALSSAEVADSVSASILAIPGVKRVHPFQTVFAGETTYHLTVSFRAR